MNTASNLAAIDTHLNLLDGGGGGWVGGGGQVTSLTSDLSRVPTASRAANTVQAICRHRLSTPTKFFSWIRMKGTV